MSQLNHNDLILFQGDSITDAGRSREQLSDMGKGYALMAAAQLAAQYPEIKLRFLNRGISGNRVKDLLSRWEKDCIELKPTWLSLMIGINDCWRRFDKNEPTSTEEFENGYRSLLTMTKKKTSAKIILCEPFALPHPEDRKKWREDLDPKIDAVRRLAREFGAYLVPFDGIFAQAACRVECDYWAGDGVHPSMAGHSLMAHHWLQCFKQAIKTQAS